MGGLVEHRPRRRHQTPPRPATAPIARTTTPDRCPDVHRPTFATSTTPSSPKLTKRSATSKTRSPRSLQPWPKTRSSRRPRIVRHSTDSFEVLLDQPDADPPAGWTTTDDGTVWTLTGPPILDDLHDDPLAVAPLIVTVGQPEADAHLYLDLEASGLLALAGDPQVATNLARSIVTELALTPLADTLRVITVGDIVELEATILEHVTIVDSWDDIADDVRAVDSNSPTKRSSRTTGPTRSSPAATNPTTTNSSPSQ